MEVGFSGESLVLDRAGVLFWPGRSVLAVADLHLEKGSASAGRGRLAPPWDTHVTLTRLAGLVRQYAPAMLVAVGDSFHDSAGAGRLGEADLALLAGIARATEIVWVEGNHDPCPPAGIAGTCAAALELGPLVFRHEARPGGRGEISGHFHPKARVATRAGGICRPCFMMDAGKIILPSFGAYTGGLEVSHPAIARHFPAGGEAFLLGKERLFRFAVAGRAARGGTALA